MTEKNKSGFESNITSAKSLKITYSAIKKSRNYKVAARLINPNILIIELRCAQ